MGSKDARYGPFFFFQAEDGIRDKLVTGVQTCALPICIVGPSSGGHHREDGQVGVGNGRERLVTGGCPARSAAVRSPSRKKRSEERRVGKECRSRGSPYH